MSIFIQNIPLNICKFYYILFKISKGDNLVMAKILVVEDNQDYQELLQNFLENAQYKITTANDGAKALDLIRQHSFDLILLDIMLPKIDGFSFCKHIRELCNNIPIIMLTALDSEEYQMHGYELKIDDYITKPVSMELLLHKVEAVLRRTMPSVYHAPSTVLHFENITLNLKTHTVCVADSLIDFTLREFEILYELMQSPTAVVTRKSLMTKLWGYEIYGDTRIIDTHIKNIRKKLGSFDCIQTIRGVGYKLIKKEEL